MCLILLFYLFLSLGNSLSVVQRNHEALTLPTVNPGNLEDLMHDVIYNGDAIIKGCDSLVIVDRNFEFHTVAEVQRYSFVLP